jgi:chloramphenicol-sensitive protein RarD
MKPVSSPPSPAALTAGIACFVIWGFVPLAFQMLGRLQVGAWEILAHRILWAAPSALLIVLAAGLGGGVRHALTARNLAWLTVSALLIATNWVVFIWAANTGQLLATSFGYYMTPLVNMAGGAWLFHERISPVRRVAIGCACAGVILQGVALGGLPAVSLALAVAFGFYGIVRKHMAVEALAGTFVECLLRGLPALGYVLWLEGLGLGHFRASAVTTVGLIAVGPITAIPLALFAWAARRIPLTVMGFLQFLTPTLSMGIGLAEGEPLSGLKLASFALVWLGMLVFAVDSWRVGRQATPAPQVN